MSTLEEEGGHVAEDLRRTNLVSLSGAIPNWLVLALADSSIQNCELTDLERSLK